MSILPITQDIMINAQDFCPCTVFVGKHRLYTRTGNVPKTCNGNCTRILMSGFLSQLWAVQCKPFSFLL